MQELGAVLGGPGTDVLGGVGADGRPGQVARRRCSDSCTITRASSASSRSGEASSGLMSISLIHVLLDDELAEADQELLERRQIDRLAAADALERRVDLGLLHHPPGQGGIERRQSRASGP